MATKIQLRGDTSANWTSANPVISDREMILVTDLNSFKIGDGVKTYSQLPLMDNGYGATEAATLATTQANTARDAANAAANAGGSPKDSYLTLAALQTTFPTGTTGIYLVTANGHWYSWKGGAWTDGGVYLANYDADIYNVTVKVPLPAFSYYTSITARNAVPLSIRKLGLKITYATSQTSWIEEQYIGTYDLTQWNNNAFWKSSYTFPISKNMKTGSSNQIGYIKIVFSKPIIDFENTLISIQDYDLKSTSLLQVSGFVNGIDTNAISISNTDFKVFKEINSGILTYYIGSEIINWKNYLLAITSSFLADVDNQPTITYVSTPSVTASIVPVNKVQFQPDVIAKFNILQGSINALGFIDPQNYSYTITDDPKCTLINGNTPYSVGVKMEYKFINKEKINGITIPIIKNYRDGLSFTDSILYKIFTENGLIKSGEIKLSELAFYNILPSNTDPLNFDYPILFDAPLLTNVGSVLQVSWACKGASDLMGLSYRNVAVNEPVSNFCNGTKFFVGYPTFAQFNSLIAYSPETQQLPYGHNLKLFVVGDTSSVTKVDRVILAPKKIYTVLNDAETTLMKRQNSAAVYLDHFFTGIKSEFDMKFEKTKSDRLVFTPKAIMNSTSISEAVLNGGVNVKEESLLNYIIGDDIKRTPITIKHISTLNSSTKLKKPFVMVVGDSVSVGQYANLFGAIGDHSDRYAYLCEEMFMRDKIISGNNLAEYNYQSIGRDAVVRTETYEGTQYTIKNFIEGLPGISSSFFSVPGSALMDMNSKFSISWYLSQFRTMTDAGVRLIAGNPLIGTLVGSVNDYDVCKPTHILINLGLNGGNGDAADILDWFNNITKIVADIKSDYALQGWAAPFIGITIPDSAGTIFPSKHPDVTDNCVEWSVECDTRRDRVASYIKRWMDSNPDTSEDANKTYFLPLFWVSPAGESVSFRPAPLPSYAVDFRSEKDWIQSGFGWGMATHVNTIGHYNYAYQLYSWIKYTLAL